MTIRNAVLIGACLVVGYASSVQAQQKGQWVPGQMGLNGGVIPQPGFTYTNEPVTYDATELKDPSGHAVSAATGTYSFWVNENIFMYVPKYKFLGANVAPFAIVNVVNGSLVADLNGPRVSALSGTNLSINAGSGTAFSDTYVQPLNLGWHLTRADVMAGYGFMAPTGRFTPGATDNEGSGYWGNFLTSGATFYLTKNRGTQASVFGGWETHGQKKDTNITPGQAFTDEWGLGQMLPLKKDKSQLLQVGVIGYDQWQTSASSGTLGPILESSIPSYSVHAVGVQSNYIIPATNLLFFFKYEDEYRALSRPQGHTIVFGGSWTLRMPKPTPTKS